MKYKGLSLFANVGIAETYLKDIKLPIVLANELLPDRVKFYEHLHGHRSITGSITDDNVFDNIVEKAKKLGITILSEDEFLKLIS